MVRRHFVRGLLYDAIDDRKGYADSCRNVPEYCGPAEAEIADFESLLARYYGVSRFTWNVVDRETFRIACIRAVSWRDSFLDSIGNTSDRALLTSAKSDLRVARAALAEFGGDAFEKRIESAGTISLWDLASSDAGTRIEVERMGNYEKRIIKENGTLLGTVIRDESGDIKAILWDGSIANEPFESLGDAQQWVIDRLSSNLLVRSVAAP